MTRLALVLGAAIAALLTTPGCGDDGGTSTPPDAGVEGGPAERRLVLLHTSDEHSHLLAFGPEQDDFPIRTSQGTGALVGGVARRAVVLAEERAAAAAAGIDTLTVSAGDQTQGALPHVAFATTSPDFTIMKALGYDVMCPGNHEFERGPATYAAAVSAALAHGGLPLIVSSNIRFSDTDPEDDALAALYGEGGSQKPIQRTHVVSTPSGIKVGFIGIMGARAASYVPNKAPVRFSGRPEDERDIPAVLPAIYADVRPLVTALRETDKVDVVIALSHGSVNPYQPDDPVFGEDYHIASNVAGLDAVVSGHSHQLLEHPQVATGPDGHSVPVVQTGVFGEYLGRLELVLSPGERPTFDPNRTRVIHIDDAIAPADTTVNAALEQLVADLESENAGGGRSFIETAISRIEGTTVTHDPGSPGSLYFRTMGTSTFDLPRRGAQETGLINLSADAMLRTVEDVAGPVLVAVQADGCVRSAVQRGLTGELSFADLFRVLPLGDSPLDGSLGYPLVRAYMWLVEIKAAMEVSASMGLTGMGYFMSATGIHVYFDTSRPEYDFGGNPLDPDNGRVTKITADTDHSDGLDDEDVVIFDVARGEAAWDSALGGQFQLHPIASNVYVASFASVAGATLKRADSTPMPTSELIVRRGDGSEIKDYEAFVGYVGDLCAANGGALPARYDETSPQGAVPQRMICSGPLCP